MPQPSVFRRISIACIIRQGVILGCAFSLLWLGNVINSPSSTRARAGFDSSAQARTMLHREFMDTLARLIGQSVEVLAVHDHSNTPYAEIVLWQHDTINPGVIDIDELAVISHSRLFKTMTVYTTQPESSAGLADHSKSQASTVKPQVAPRPGAAAGRNALRGEGLRLPMASVSANMMLDRAAVSDSGFCDRWRASPQVLPRVLGTELSDFMVEPAGPSGEELSALRLTLTWAANSSDGAQDMSVLVKLMSSPRLAMGIPGQDASE
jgi:hypothetical protein